MGTTTPVSGNTAPDPATHADGPRTTGRSRSSLGAIVAVLATVLGAVALTAVIGSGMSGLLAAIRPEPSSALATRMSVYWDENEDTNNYGSATVAATIQGIAEESIVIAASRSDLCFDAVATNAGWPPDLGDWLYGGLTSYRIEVTLDERWSEPRIRMANAIVRTATSDRFCVLVPRMHGDPQVAPFDLDKARRFAANAQGLIDLAKDEKSDWRR